MCMGFRVMCGRPTPAVAGRPACLPCLQVILNTSREVGDLRELLNTIYDDLFVEYVVKNPSYSPGQAFQ